MRQGEQDDMQRPQQDDVQQPPQDQSNTGHNNVQFRDVTDSEVHVTQVVLTNQRASALDRLRDLTSPAMFDTLDRVMHEAHFSAVDLLRAVREGALTERAGRPAHLPITKLKSWLLAVLMLLPMAQLTVLLVMAWPVALRSAWPALFWLSLVTGLVTIYVISQFYLPHRTAAQVVRFLSSRSG